MRYRMKLRKGSSTLSGKVFYIANIQNDRILATKETYAYLCNEVGGKRADHASAWKAFFEYVKDNAANGNSTRAESLGVFRNIVKGGFETSVGPWVRGRNRLEIECIELAEFKNALEGMEAVNATQGDKPIIKSVLDTALEEYDVLRVGDLLSMAGQNLAPDTENEDEYVALLRGDELVKKATVSKSEINVVEFKFEGVTLEPGEYRLAVYTRCGDSGEDVSVKSATRTVRVVTAA